MAKQCRIFCVILLGVFATTVYAAAQSGIAAEQGGPKLNNALDQENDPVGSVVAKRDPFWPVGYAPEPAKTADVAPSEDQQEEESRIDFSGLSKEEQAIIKSKMIVGGILQQGHTCMAIINNQLIKEGEGLVLQSASRTYQFTVKKLTQEKILLESMQ